MTDPANDGPSLTARARNFLRELARGAVPYRRGRNLPMEYRELLDQGLAFHSHFHLTITPKGEEVAERCT